MELNRDTVLALALALAVGAVLAAFVGARPSKALPQCLCGHDARAHEHNRPGTWCGVCPRYGEDACVHYVPTKRPSWSNPRPSDGEDGDEIAARFLRAWTAADGSPSPVFS